jgi:hypothetical protein
MEQNVLSEKPILFAVDTILQGYPIVFMEIMVLNSMYELPFFLFLLFVYHN